MAWQQLVIELGSLDPETVEAVLAEFGAASVTLSDSGDNPVLEPAPGETPLWPATRLTALFEATHDLDCVAADVAQRLGIDALPAYRLETLEDRDWEREWLRDFGPMRFGDRLWVCPRGTKAPDADAVIVELDPGLAFGTGTHPTTALCLAWLDSLPLEGKTVIDYGAGSGILAIAALKLGAQRALAYDIDPQAVIATRENAKANGVADRLEVTLRKDDLRQPADVVIANILAGPLIELATEILDLTITGGTLALSGILSEQVPEVSRAYASGLRLDPPAYQDQDGQTWARLTGIRL
ncbi:MAG: 50S ribosomal protein L11 methyltransferase [Woeseiaceae bacterium]|jgi:ribosomal protein L11 methyltransferase|nr:50S ribosomal protein L11 methyltransferase [Woeseiaceae bacterium]